MESRGQAPDVVLGLMHDPAASPVGVLLVVATGLLAVLGGCMSCCSAVYRHDPGLQAFGVL